VAFATSPLSYNSGTQTISIDLSSYATQSFVTSQGYITVSALTPYLTSATAATTYYPLTNPAGYITSSALTGYATQSWVTSQGYITASALSPYLTSATAASTYLTIANAATTYAPIAAAVPTGGSTGQVLTKTSGTDYALSWETPVVGDRYLTTSTTSNTINNSNKTFTIGTGLSYTPTQNLTISYNAANHMHGEVLTYNSGTGVLTVDIKNHTGSGTYTAWVVNVGGVTPATSVAWGAITGTLSTQTDLQTALDLKAALESPTFTTRIYTPAIRNILNTDLVVDAYNDTGAGTHYLHKFTPNDGKFVLATNGGGLTFPDSTTQTTAGIPDAPSDGTPYVRLDGAWEQLIIT
jgi:hypothetical protein